MLMKRGTLEGRTLFGSLLLLAKILKGCESDEIGFVERPDARFPQAACYLHRTAANRHRFTHLSGEAASCKDVRTCERFICTPLQPPISDVVRGSIAIRLTRWPSTTTGIRRWVLHEPPP